MSDVAIRVEGLSKEFRIGAQQPAYRTLRETVTEAFLQPFRRKSGSTRERTFLALNGVSFEVKRGEILGLIGRNGAGKSTLLKILARITPPSAGHAEIVGRLGSLLEVGTGFHPELTGRENVYLNAAILGMTRSETRRKFDEIMDFAEIQEFIDTPVKHYSSGMYMRLAFAVAAHLEPDILLVDEVLAVGDVRFQKKCLNKMQDVAEHGRTVIFVSHNMPAVTRLCQRVLLLEGGKLTADGPAPAVVRAYLMGDAFTIAQKEWPDRETAPGREITRLRAVRVVGRDGRVTDTVDIRHPVRLEMEYDVIKPGCVIVSSFVFTNEAGVDAFVVIDTDPEWRHSPRPCGRWVTSVTVPGNFLSEGMMIVSAAQLAIDPIRGQFDVRSIVAFHVVDSMEGDSARGDYGGPLDTIVRPLLPWTSRMLG